MFAMTPRLQNLFLCAGVLMLATTGLPALQAEAAGSHRLGTQVVPVTQAVRLVLDADKIDYTGTTTISVEVKQKTKSFEIHAEEMNLERAVISGGSGEMELTPKAGKNGRVTLTAAKNLGPGAYTLAIEFSNNFGTKAVGLYRMEQDGQGYAFTQFEADDAREAFPCWDEPSYKIPWQMTISVPEGHVAVTNTPVLGETSENGMRTFTFARSKPLPSYLIAIATGPLVSVDIPGMSVPGKIYTVKGQSQLTATAVKMTPPILAALERYFDGDYPYEKLDFIAIPEYWPGAMEHPGAVTYATTILLADPEAVSVQQKSRMARVIAHELAHMWFGDLVTMEWWDDLWLNESFADWMGDKITHEVYPELAVEVTELQSSIQVMNQDARPSSQAIRQPVTNTDDLLQNVGLQYNKGKAVLAMFEQWVSPEKFRAGVLAYIKEHAWGNATSNDLWAALGQVSGNDVASAMATFVDQPGLPLVTMEVLPDNAIKFTQTRSSNFGAQQKDQLWKIPITFRVSGGRGLVTETFLLTQKSATVPLDLYGEASWYLPNANQQGYYRWQVPAEDLKKMAGVASDSLNVRERVGFLANLAALLDAGEIGGDNYLAALAEFADDPDPLVISSLLNEMQKIDLTFITSSLRTPFASYVRQSLGPAMKRLGMEAKSREDETVALVRPQIIRWLGDQGQDAAIREEAGKMARAYMEDSKAVDPSLATAWLRLAAVNGDRALFDEYRQRFETAQDPTERARYLSGMGSFRNPSIIAAALDYTLAGQLRPNELFTIPRRINETPANRDQVFDWFMANYENIGMRIPPVYLSYMPMLATGCSAPRLAKAETFFGQKKNQASGTLAQLAKTSDQVNDCVSLRDREGAKVAAYLNQLVGSR
jgi:alanyl aminopeptidase